MQTRMIKNKTRQMQPNNHFNFMFFISGFLVLSVGRYDWLSKQYCGISGCGINRASRRQKTAPRQQTLIRLFKFLHMTMPIQITGSSPVYLKVSINSYLTRNKLQGQHCFFAVL
jgi:hypothetical protein